MYNLFISSYFSFKFELKFEFKIHRNSGSIIKYILVAPITLTSCLSVIRIK